ncbi:unnamed protein product [Cylindrotheca closterium]|uniref:Uncharacterized protein n=1 Tax=Cylindrotheca closterium TaxID=2856 RepID=A0AAD2CKL7_9STRA|nr:unnamed protein product [Cylindrotheca closterium]
MLTRRLLKTLLVLSSLGACSAFAPTVGGSSKAVLQQQGLQQQRCSPLVVSKQSNKQIHNNGQSSTRLKSVMEIIGTSPEPIHTAFSFATFGPQPFWLLLIFLPKADITKKVMGSLDVVVFFALTHFFIVASSIVQPGATAPLLEFNEVFNPGGDPQAAFMNMVTNYPNFVAEEWSHVLTWDLFVGRWVWLDGLRRGVFTSHSVLFCNLIGPPGLVLHWITCLVSGKGFGENEAPEEMEE